VGIQIFERGLIKEKQPTFWKCQPLVEKNVYVFSELPEDIRKQYQKKGLKK